VKFIPRLPIFVVTLCCVALCGSAFAQEVPATPPATTDTAVATPAAPVAEPAQEPAPAAAPALAAETANADTATVVIYRAKSVVGMALHPTVMLDGKDLINVANGTVWKGSFTPGHYLFEMDDKKTKADLDLVKGQTYYFHITLVPGVWKGGGKLTQVSADEGAKGSAALKPLPEKEIEHPIFKGKK
jgi:hypothetical protein